MGMASVLGKMLVAGLVAKGVSKMVSGGGSGGGGGIGSVLGGLLGGDKRGAGDDHFKTVPGRKSEGGGGIGDLLGSVLGGAQNADTIQASREQDQQAEVLLRAMLNAAKADGDIDQGEQERIVKHLGDISEEEANFLRSEMAAPVNVDSFVRSVPRGMEQQVYVVSLTAIDLDNQKEAQYLHQLAQGLGISQQTCNYIHEKIGAPKLYS